MGRVKVGAAGACRWRRLQPVVSGSGRVNRSRDESQLPVRLRRQPDVSFDGLRVGLARLGRRQLADRLPGVPALPARGVVAVLFVRLRGAADGGGVCEAASSARREVLRCGRLAVRRARRRQPAVQCLVLATLL